jgi:hypothetical protein
MQGSEDRPNFESDFGFLLFWFDDFRRVVKWATGFLLFRFDGRRISFFFFFFLVFFFGTLFFVFLFFLCNLSD